MLFCFLLTFLSSSSRFCLCQPDKSSYSCSLSKKCKNFRSNSEIIIFDELNSSIFHDLNDEKILFEVYGSPPSRPITLDLSRFGYKTIQIFGGEYNQLVNVRNFQKAENQSLLDSQIFSLEAKNIQIFFEDQTNLLFDSLKLEQSVIKGNEKLNIIAHNLIGDSRSLSSEYLNNVRCGKLKVNDNNPISAKVEVDSRILDQEDIDNAEFKKTKDVSEDSHKKSNLNTKSLNDLGNINLLQDNSEVNSNQGATYRFCLVTRNRYSIALNSRECDPNSVDINNYYSGKEQEFLDIISTAPPFSKIYFYVTTSTENDPIRLNFAGTLNQNNVSLCFVTNDNSLQTNVELKGSGRSELDIMLNVSNINSFRIDRSYARNFSYIALTSSQIDFINTVSDVFIRNLITDTTSISSFSGKNLIIENSITLSRASPMNLNGNIIIAEGGTINIDQYSNFPIVRLNYNSTESI